MSIRPILLALAAFISFFAEGQPIKIFSSDGNLSSCLLNKIYQDSRGYVWIATEYGLNRFDGVRFVTYKNIPGDSTSLCDNYVRTVFESRDGNFLVGSLNGLMEWDRANDSFRKIHLYMNGVEVSPHIAEIAQLSNGEIWVGTAGYGIFRLDSELVSGTRLDELSATVGSDMISCIMEDSDHAMWIGTENRGVCRYYPGGAHALCYKAPELGGNKVSSLLQGDDGSVYIGLLDGGVDRFDPVSSTLMHMPYSDRKLSVKTLGRYGSVCYAGTEGEGVKMLSGNVITDVPVGSDLAYCSDGKVHQILQDREGNLWIGLFQHGVAFIPRRSNHFEYFGRKSSLSNPIGNGCVMAVSTDRSGHLWVSCDNDGIYRLDSNNRRLQSIDTSCTALCFHEDSRGCIWAGTFNDGLVKINGNATIDRVSRFREMKIYDIVEDGEGWLYLGTLGNGLICYNPDTDTEKRLAFHDLNKQEGNLTNDWINYLYPTDDGKIWIAHYNGISCYDTTSDKYVKFGSSCNLVSGCIGYAIVRTGDGKLWLGTSGGLYIYDSTSGSLVHLTTDDGLPNNVICGICEDEGHNIWLSTYHGIAKYVVDEGRFIAFDSGDGLQGNEFTHGTFCKDRRGMIYFGGNQGVTAFHPLDINDNPREYRPVITRFDIFTTPVNALTMSGNRRVIDRPIDEAETVTLSATDNTFNILFSTITYNNPDKLTYQYRITELGKQWLTTEPGQSCVTFSNMSPGTYHFYVRVAGDDSPKGTRSLTIIITPPWYQSWWAMIIYAIVIVLTVILAMYYIKLRILSRREQTERRQAEQILEARLQFFTNISHEIRTPMTLIINPLEKLILETEEGRLKNTYIMIYRNAQRILRLVNQLMDMRKLEKGQMKLRFRETDLIGFVSDTMQPFEYVASKNVINFTLHHDMPVVNVWIDPDNFDKILLNILSNAFKYTPKGGNIDISIAERHDDTALPPFKSYVEISISDTGIGIDADKIERIFDRFYRIENEMTSFTAGTGIGLHLCRSLVTLHHGTIHARNHVGESGCEFIIRLPLGSNHLSADEIAAETPDLLKQRHIMPEAEGTGDEAPPAKSRTRHTVAIVEDDTEILNYLINELSPYYRISAFSNGEDALTGVLTDTPDLIVSDVMMPGLDGYALCRKIKQNVNINHIPVILLSAKSENEDRMAGLRSGADAYLTKPFSTDVLNTTITNLLANRNLLRAKFSGAQEQPETLKKIELKSQNEVLLARIMDVINENISSPDFNVERLAEEVGLSRVHLYRKLKELTDLSAREFIKSLRMKQASRLLREKKLTVAEVAYATGFSNPSHFASAFKDIYGMTPTQYATAETGA